MPASDKSVGHVDLFALDSSDDGEDIVAGAERKVAVRRRPGGAAAAVSLDTVSALHAAAGAAGKSSASSSVLVTPEVAAPRAPPEAAAAPVPATAHMVFGGAPSPDNILTRDPEALQRQLQEVLRNGAASWEEISQYQEALQDREAYLACYKEESRTLNLQVARMKQDVGAQVAEAAARLASEDVEARLQIMQQTDDEQQRAIQIALRAANEEVYRRIIQIDQLRLAHFDVEQSVIDARHNAEEKAAELQAARELLVEMSGRDSGNAGAGPLDRADAEGLAQTLRAECEAKNAMLQEMSQEILSHERLAANSAMQTKANEDRLAAARQRMQELEDQLGAAANS